MEKHRLDPISFLRINTFKKITLLVNTNLWNSLFHKQHLHHQCHTIVTAGLSQAYKSHKRLRIQYKSRITSEQRKCCSHTFFLLIAQALCGKFLQVLCLEWFRGWMLFILYASLKQFKLNLNIKMKGKYFNLITLRRALNGFTLPSTYLSGLSLLKLQLNSRGTPTGIYVFRLPDKLFLGKSI